MSATERDKCSLSSLLPMSCRDRAEAFARHLHTRLRSLDPEADNSSANESSWLAAHETPITVSHQPRHHSDSEIFFNFTLLDSPDSPEEEITESEIARLINNKDNLRLTHCQNCNSSKMPSYAMHVNAIAANSHDSDSSDGPYYDTETETHPSKEISYHHLNGTSTLESPEENEEAVAAQEDNDTGQLKIADQNHLVSGKKDYCNGSLSESPLTSELSGLLQSCNDDESTLSLRDDDYPSMDCISNLTDVSLIENQEESREEEIPELPKENGYCTDEDAPTISNSSLSVEKELIAVCPTTNLQITKCESLDINQEERPLESQAFLEVGSSNIFESGYDDVDKETRIPRVRRCSSLKTGKTPPGTPSRKKIVRFADVLGLDLADVRTFLDEIPKIPISAYYDLLVDADLKTSVSDTTLNSFSQFSSSACFKTEKLLFPLFQQPGGQPNFLDKVREKTVCLENAVVNDPADLSIKGTVRVRNLDFHKSVHVRYTLDSWKTYADLQTTYVENSCDGFSDTFRFLLYAHTLTEGQKLEFAVRFQCKGCQYWDNNYGSNYCFQCLPSSNHISYLTTGNYGDSWSNGFYYENESTDLVHVKLVSVNPQDDMVENQKEERSRLRCCKRGVRNVKLVRNNNVNVSTVFVILFFSVFFMYLQVI